MKIRTRNAKSVTRCPACESKRLMEFDGDHFCLSCDWDSLKVSVDRGDLDNIFEAWNNTQIHKQNSDASLLDPPTTVVVANPKNVGGNAA